MIVLANKSTSPRQLNLELLRIVAMFMVLAIHYNLPVRGKPTIEALHNDIAYTGITILLQSILIVCVFDYYTKVLRWIVDCNMSWHLEALAIISFMVAVFVVAVLIDKIRITVFGGLSRFSSAKRQR